MNWPLAEDHQQQLSILLSLRPLCFPPMVCPDRLSHLSTQQLASKVAIDCTMNDRRLAAYTLVTLAMASQLTFSVHPTFFDE
jgi:hypothetical protein